MADFGRHIGAKSDCLRSELKKDVNKKKIMLCSRRIDMALVSQLAIISEAPKISQSDFLVFI